MSESVAAGQHALVGESPQPAISLQGISKHYPGASRPAVDRLDLEVPQGAMVMLLGPSGCGKTTTLKMINRLVEPSTGRILLGGEDVTEADPDQLRRQMGYVIQQVGLFPHFSVGDNIAVVPKMLGWDKSRVARRVDELLDLVGLEPSVYRDRRPRQLSGGQQQRVGVARGLAADPPVMLMDEPFGAIDPITRERLQDEFIELQRQVRKTICFVTHDLEEAVKLGDRIAIFGPEGRLAQYATPEEILSHPADEFVTEFVGQGASVRRLRVLDLDRIELEPLSTHGADPEGSGAVVELGPDGRPRAWRRLPGHDSPPELTTIPAQSSLYDAVAIMLDAAVPVVAVFDDDSRPRGVLRWESLIEQVGRERDRV